MAGSSPRLKRFRHLMFGKGALLAMLLVGAPALAAVLWKAESGAGDRSTASSRRNSVSSAQELSRALNEASDGDVIALAPGHYPRIVINGVEKTGNVTIASADPARPAVIASLLVRKSAGLTFRDLELAATADAAWTPARRQQSAPAAGAEPAGGEDERPGGAASRFPFQVVNSQRIVLDRLDVHGPRNDRAAAYWISALMLRASRDITLSNSRFSTLWHGVAMLRLDGLAIVDNEFRDIRTDGVRGGGISNTRIAGNVFTDFHPVPKDHPDGIQLWSTPDGAAMTNIAIHDNLIVRGKGAPTQGIFIRDVRNKRPFQNLEIRDNLVMGSLYNGIAMNGVQGGRIVGNEVINYPDRKKTWIRVDNCGGIEIKGNRAPFYNVTRSEVDQSGNGTNGLGGVEEARHVKQWLDAKPARRRPSSRLQSELTASAS